MKTGNEDKRSRERVMQALRDYRACDIVNCQGCAQQVINAVRRMLKAKARKA